ncbi:MAG: fumarylacetoacetate hydrolase family protein [Candidatus Poribacteria bacterium]|nr:fumarylacetoacetate hydrolase family protein [Candidatus Poribacteria bacterium]
MKLVTFELTTQLGKQHRLGAWIDGDRVVDLNLAYALYLSETKGHTSAHQQANAILPSDMLQYFERGDVATEAAHASLQYVQERDVSGAQDEQIIYPVDGIKLLAPFPRPASLRDFGVFRTHMDAAAKITGKEISPEWFKLPNYYRGSTSPASIVGNEAIVTWPNYTEKLDFELEWGVYIGKAGRNISIEDAPNYIAGYTIYNDISARDIQFRHMTMALGPAKGKDFDNSNIMGPCLVTPDEIGDPHNLRMIARVNGEVWADGNTSDMYYTFAEMISFVSQSETLYPGEFLGSGTVGKGCGWELDRWIEPGDLIELEIEKIGVLRNRIGEKEENPEAWKEKQ